MTKTNFLLFFKVGHRGGVHRRTMETPLNKRQYQFGSRDAVMSKMHGALKKSSLKEEDMELGSE